MFKVKQVVRFGRIKEASNKVTQSINSKFERLEQKVQGTFAEKWFAYWKQVCKDYRDVAFDIVKDVKEKPAKGLLIGTTSCLLVYAAKHNPSSSDFRDCYLRNANDVALVNPELVRKEARDHLKFIEHSFNNDLIRYYSFGIFSIIWIDNYGSKCNKYEAQCSYLQVNNFEVIHRIIDMGFLDTWWVMAKKMTDYDINY